MKRGIFVISAALSLLIIAYQSTGEMKITTDGVTFQTLPNASILPDDLMASSPTWSQILPDDAHDVIIKN